MKIGDGSTRLWIKTPLVAPSATASATSAAFPPLPPVAEASSAVMIKVEEVVVKAEAGVEMTLSSYQHSHGMDSTDNGGGDSDGTSSKRARMLEEGEEASLGRLMTSDITDLKGWHIASYHNTTHHAFTSHRIITLPLTPKTFYHVFRIVSITQK